MRNAVGLEMDARRANSVRVNSYGSELNASRTARTFPAAVLVSTPAVTGISLKAPEPGTSPPLAAARFPAPTLVEQRVERHENAVRAEQQRDLKGPPPGFGDE